MIRQLVQGLFATGLPAAPPLPDVAAGNLVAASEAILGADPLDLMLYMEQRWDCFSPSAGPARRNLFSSGRFNNVALISDGDLAVPGWDHLACSYVLENTRAIQILRRVVRQFRLGEKLGVPSEGTRRWLDATEVLLSGTDSLIPSSLPSSAVHKDPEAVRRNAYWRLFGMDLAFGTEDSQAAIYDRANVANTEFAGLFEGLLFELRRTIANTANDSACNDSDRDRVYRIAQELQTLLAARRRGKMLDHAELMAATQLGWINLTLDSDTAVVMDLKAQASSAADRLKLIGERVGLPAHAKSAALFSMSEALSVLVRAVESTVMAPDTVEILYLPGPIREAARRVITEWSAATGKDLRATS